MLEPQLQIRYSMSVVYCYIYLYLILPSLTHKSSCYLHIHANECIIGSQIMTGKLPATKQEYIFPHNASHQQILAQTGTLCMSDPKIRPPPIPTAKRWMGDDVGWV